ncbi:hypothetical protein JKF63_02616 [Porcisia hertigi]|uniref:Uncharacterized protein n=1 Tax=Porcisia hertigi TaxID=2761500 RepID=A0A836HRJ2_9TRYP|nr:hypothetical protein JKF63_02616 [Porcisia hertigi]
MCANGGACGPTMAMGSYGNPGNYGVGLGGVHSTLAKPLSPPGASVPLQNLGAGAHPCVSYPGSHVATRPGSSFFYPPYSVVKQYASWPPQAAGVMQGQVPSPQEYQRIASSGTAPALIPEGHSAIVPGFACGTQNASMSPPVKKSESHHRGRHYRGDDNDAVHLKMEPEPSSLGENGAGGGRRERRHHRHGPPVDVTSSTRAPSPSTATPFGGVFPDGSNNPNAHHMPTATIAAGSGVDGGGGGGGNEGGRRRRRHRRGGSSGERRRDVSQNSTPGRQANEDAKGLQRRGHRHRSESRGRRCNSHSETSRSGSASPRPASDHANRSHHHHSKNQHSHRWDSPTDTIAANAAISARLVVPFPSLGVMPPSAVGAPVSPSVAVSSTPVVVSPPSPGAVPAAPSNQNALPIPSPPLVTAPSLPPAVQPVNTSRGHRRYRNRRGHRDHHRPRSASSMSGSHSYTELSRGSSSYSSSLSTNSGSTSRPASVPLRSRRRRRRKNRRGRRSTHQPPRAASLSLTVHPATGPPAGGAPSPPMDGSASVARAPKEKGLRGILGFFRRGKPSAAKANATTVNHAEAPVQQAVVSTPVIMPPQVVYNASTGFSGASALPWGVVNGSQLRRTDGHFESPPDHHLDHSGGSSQHLAQSNGAIGGPIFLRQSYDNNNVSAGRDFSVAPSTKGRGIFGGLFRKNKNKAVVSFIPTTVAPAAYAGGISVCSSLPSYSLTAGSPANFDTHGGATIRFENPPASPTLAPPGGGYRGASMYGTPAANTAPMPKPGFFERLMKKMNSGAEGKHKRNQPQIPQELVNQIELQHDVPTQRRGRHRRSGGNRGRHRHDNSGHVSPVDEHGGPKMRRHVSGHRDISSRNRTRGPPPPTFFDGQPALV